MLDYPRAKSYKTFGANYLTLICKLDHFIIGHYFTQFDEMVWLTKE